MHTGHCHCRAIAFRVDGAPIHSSLCHCEDCRRCAGAPVVAWVGFPTTALTVTKGDPAVYASSEGVRRHFCGLCGSGLFYFNEAALPGVVDVQTAVFDDPEALPPALHVQTAERLGWMKTAHELPVFERFPE